MKRPTIIFLLATVLSCSQKVEDIQLLNGYWEIEKVIINGETKEYTINENLDHIVLNDSLSGKRTKARVFLDGSFEDSSDPEFLTVSNENKQWKIHYKTKFSEWTETIKKLDQDHLEVVNEDHRTYIYKRFKPKTQP